MNRIEPEKREEWEYKLNEPLPGHEPSRLQLEQESDTFMSAMSTLKRG